MRKFVAYALITVLMVAGYSAYGADAAEAKPRLSYTAKVLKGTWGYKPCVKMRKTRDGRIMYWDTVRDNWDDSRKRPVKAQVKYVLQACRNGA